MCVFLEINPLKIDISLDYFLFFNLVGVSSRRVSVDHFSAYLGRKASSEETVNTDHGQISKKQT